MLTQEYLKECLHYDPETGVFVWKQRPESHFKTRQGWLIHLARYEGQPAGHLNSSRKSLKYWEIRLDKNLYLAHRLAWLYVNGEMPLEQIDHIDGDGLNNSIKNLRVVSNQENNKNQSLRSTNKSGKVGVRWDNRLRKWSAYITVDGVFKSLGFYKDKNSAVSARVAAEILHGFHPNHGRAKK